MIEVNVLAILVSGLMVFVFGWLWYSPILFGKQWMALNGFSQEQMEAGKKGMWTCMLFGLISYIVMAYVLSHFGYLADVKTFGEGMILGFWVWLGFIATTSLGSVLWEKKPFKLWVLNNVYHLIGLMLMGGVLAVWM